MSRSDPGPGAAAPLHRGGLLGRLASGFAVLGGTFALGLWAGSGVVQSAYGAGQDAYGGFATLARVLGTIEAQYLEERSTQALLESATRGLAADLDPHSRWMDAETWQRLQEQAEGVADGAGLVLRMEADSVAVRDVTAHGPADLAGIQAGDLLTHVDGDAVASAEAATAALAGRRGDPKDLDLLRDGVAVNAHVVLDQVEEQVVFVSRKAQGVFVSIRHFSRSTAHQLDRSLSDLPLQPAEPLLLDLRDNPGGLMDQAVAVVDRFVGDGVVVETRGRDGVSLQIDRSHDDASDLTNPLVVLVNEETASAAEVVAGALQDRDRAQLVGRRTYGKGTVQQVYALEDGSALKLTRARYHLPSGRALADREGLVPDVSVLAGPEMLREQLRTVLAGSDLQEQEQAALSAALESALPAPDTTDPIQEAGWRTLGQ